MESVQLNETTIYYEHVAITASSNILTGAKWYTKIWVESYGHKYLVGEVDEKLDGEMVKLLFEEKIKGAQKVQYGQSRGFLRKNLSKKNTPRTTTRGISGSVLQLNR